MTSNERLAAYINATESARKSFNNAVETGGLDHVDQEALEECSDVYVAGYVAHWRETYDELERYTE